MPDSPHTLSALRRRIAALEKGRPTGARHVFASGHQALDDAMGGGFAAGRLHEVFGADIEDIGSASGFALLLALLAGEGKGAPLLWLRTDGGARRGGGIYGPGLAELGVDPARMVLGVMRDEAMLLRAAADALRCVGLGAVVIECWGDPRILDLTVSRRLTLAAEASGVTPILLRLDAHITPSAAETRWRVAAAPSVVLPGNASGPSAFDIELLRRRAGPDGLHWRLEWNRDERCFAEWNRAGRGQQEQTLSGALVPFPGAGPAADRAAGPLGAAA